MGTSSARRGPTGPFWRLAKRAASRYLSPGTAGRVAAREVAARYVAALGEGSAPPDLAGALAAFRLTRRVAQNLGAFYCQAASRGWPAALDAWGLKEAAGEEVRAVPAHSLSAALEFPGGGLEQAVAHTALMGLLLQQPPGGRRAGDFVPVPVPVPEAERPGWCGAFWGTPSLLGCSWTWGNPWKLRPRASPLSSKAPWRSAAGLSKRRQTQVWRRRPSGPRRTGWACRAGPGSPGCCRACCSN